MRKLPKVVGWKAVDGRVFEIDTIENNIENMEQLQEHIAELRKKHGYDEPTFMHVDAKPGYDVGTTVDVEELPDDLKEKVKQVISEGLNKPDPNKLN